MKKNFQITKEGKAQLAAELERLKNRRGEIAEKIATAREFGDLSENAEYDSARNEQGILETRVAEIEEILAWSQIIKAQKTDVVGLGNTVTLEQGAKTLEYMIVGAIEADPLLGKVSDVSPVGIALKGLRVGETAKINTPKGELSYKVLEIK